MKPKPRPEAWDCRVARASEWSQALECWFGQALHADQLYSLYFQLEHEPGLAQGLWLARHNDDIDAVAWIIPTTGSFTHSWPLRCRVHLDSWHKQSVAAQLWKTITAHYHAKGSRFFQVNVPIQCKADTVQMLEIGFKEIARIQRLSLLLKQEKVRNDSRLIHLKPAGNTQDIAFAEQMIETMSGSLDVPELNAYQLLEDVTAQYQKPGVERFFVQHASRETIGVIALHHDGERGHIRYLGLLPPFRRKGFGEMALHQAIAYLSAQGCEKVDLRVDARNVPALALYHGAGFEFAEEESMLLFV